MESTAVLCSVPIFAVILSLNHFTVAGAATPVSLSVTLNANILAQQVANQLGKGVSAVDPNSKIPGTEAHRRYQAAILAAQTVSAQESNQKNAAATTVSNSAQNICSGVYVQKLGPLVPPEIVNCDDSSQCTLQAITDPASVGVPPANVPSDTVLMTLPANCSCPFDLLRPGKSIRAGSYSPQDQYSNIDTPVIAYSPRFGCQVLQHVTTPPEKAPIVPKFTDDGVPPVVLDWPVATKGSPGAFPDVDYDAIQTQINQFFPDTAPPNVSQGIKNSDTYAIGVFYKGKLVAEKYNTAKGFNASTKLNSNSMHKSFFINYLAGLRSVEGKISINDLFGAPHWGEELILERNIKMDNLLRMNAGVISDHYIDEIAFLDEPDMPAFGAGLALKYAPPGAVWDYSNINYHLAALALRNSFNGDDNAYWSYATNKLYKRVGAADVTLAYDAQGNVLQSILGMYATMYDYAKLGSVFLNGGKFQGAEILPKDWVDYSLTPTPGSYVPSGGNYGASWWLNSFPNVQQYHYSANGAFGQRVVIVPDKDLIMLHFGLATGAVSGGYVWNSDVGNNLFGNITSAIH
ncbi:g10088 [Coccomyxa elongata]